MKKLSTVILALVMAFFFAACAGEEIDACVGASSDPVTYDVDCDDCCKDNGYKRGVTSTTSSGGNTTRTCKCSGDPD